MVEDRELWDEFIKTRSPKLREELILKYLSFVKAVFYAYISVHRQSGLESKDLLQEGVIGLIRAVDRFDPARGTQFQTYARWRIQGQIRDALRKASFFPQHLRRDLEWFRELLASSPDITDEEVVQVMGVFPGRVRVLRRYHNAAILSLNTRVYPDSEDTWIDLLKDTGKSSEDPYETKGLWDTILEALSCLSARDRYVFELYFIEGYLMREIAEVVGLSESRVSQIVQEVLQLLRDRLRKGRICG